MHNGVCHHALSQSHLREEAEWESSCLRV